MLYIIIILISLIFLYYLLRSKNIIESYNKIPSILHKTGPYDEPTYELQNIFFYNKKRLNLNNLYYYNDKDCKNLVDSIDYRISQAYDSLIPTAYKADIWRYCVLYKYGGVYGDLTQTNLLEYDFNEKNCDMVLTKDRYELNCKSLTNIQISFMASKPNNNFLLFLIENISKNILEKDKGTCTLDVTGPKAFGRYFCIYFNTKKIPLGISYFRGLDNQEYKINIPFYMHDNDYIFNIEKKKFIKNKIKDHIKLIYKSDNGIKNKNKYHYQWHRNNVFK